LFCIKAHGSVVKLNHSISSILQHMEISIQFEVFTTLLVMSSMKNLTKASSLFFHTSLLKKKIHSYRFGNSRSWKSDQPIYYKHFNSSRSLINLSSSENVQQCCSS
jgi:hypothetical protein